MLGRLSCRRKSQTIHHSRICLEDERLRSCTRPMDHGPPATGAIASLVRTRGAKAAFIGNRLNKIPRYQSAFGSPSIPTAVLNIHPSPSKSIGHRSFSFQNMWNPFILTDRHIESHSMRKTDLLIGSRYFCPNISVDTPNQVSVRPNGFWCSCDIIYNGEGECFSGNFFSPAFQWYLIDG